MFVGDWTATLSFVIQFGSAKTSAEVTSTTALAQKLTCSSTWVEFRKFRVFFLVYLSEVDRGCTRAKIFYGEDDYRWDLLVSCAATNPKCMIFAAWPDRLFPPCSTSRLSIFRGILNLVFVLLLLFALSRYSLYCCFCWCSCFRSCCQRLCWSCHCKLFFFFVDALLLVLVLRCLPRHFLVLVVLLCFSVLTWMRKI
jgi:hypothetical protein